MNLYLKLLSFEFLRFIKEGIPSTPIILFQWIPFASMSKGFVFNFLSINKMKDLRKETKENLMENLKATEK